MRRVPICDLTRWNPPTVGRADLTMRPGIRALFAKLLWSAILAATAGMIYAHPGVPASVAKPIGIGVAILAVLPLAGFVFGKLRLSRDPRGYLDLFYWNYLPMWRRWRMDRFDRLALYVREDVRVRGAGPRTEWLWIAQPQKEVDLMVPFLGHLNFTSGNVPPIFALDRQQLPPDTLLPLPERVEAFVQAFQQATGLPPGNPVLQQTSTCRKRDGASGEYSMLEQKETTFHSIDEVPPEMRAQFQEMIERARQKDDGVYQYRSERISITDESGTTRVYNSIDELPPEVRDRLPKFK